MLYKIKMTALLWVLFVFSCNLNAETNRCEHEKGRTQNTLIPDFIFELTPKALSENTAVSFLGEAGRRNFRCNGTAGFLLGFDDRFKISAEYLQQKLGYNFSSGRADRWVRQYAMGAAYRHDFCNGKISGAELSGYWSFAPGRDLNRKVCVDRYISRHIAGSTAYGFSIGAEATPFSSTIFKADLDYDVVIYHRKYRSNRHITGIGANVQLYQRLFCNLALDLLGEFRRPFNFYRGRLIWTPPQWRSLSIALFASHVRGRYHLPSNTIAGLELNYSFGESRPQFNLALPCCENDVCDPCCEIFAKLRNFVSTPAVYMPEVLAIAEEKVCKFPLNSSQIPNFTFTEAGPFVIDVSPYFSNPEGGSLTFSAIGLPPDASIDPETGIISGTVVLNNTAYSVTVTAANKCSKVSQTFLIVFDCLEVTITGQIPNFNYTEAGPFEIDVSSYFSSQDLPLTFSATGLPPGASIDPQTGIISGTVVLNDTTYTVAVTASNDCSSASQSFFIVFGECTAIPTSVPIPNQSFCGPDPYSFDVSSFFTDPPGGTPLVFSATGLPTGSTIDSSTGVISGPNLQDNNVYTVTVTATNACGFTSQTFTISFPCTAPTSTPITPNPFNAPNTPTYSFDASSFFTSPCGQPFTFSLSGDVPPGTTIDSTTGVISGPTVPAIDPFTFTVTGTTTCGSTSQSWSIIFQSA